MACIRCDGTGYSGGDTAGNRTRCRCNCHDDGGWCQWTGPMPEGWHELTDRDSKALAEAMSASAKMVVLPEGMTYTPARLDVGVLTILRDSLAEMADPTAYSADRVRLDFCRSLTNLLLASLAPPELIHTYDGRGTEITPPAPPGQPIYGPEAVAKMAEIKQQTLFEGWVATLSPEDRARVYAEVARPDADTPTEVTP